jgi:Trypsin-co-occurring domain 1
MTARTAWPVAGRLATGGSAVAEVVRFQVDDGSSVLVEVDEDAFGVERVSRGADGIVEAGRRLTDALGNVRAAAQASVDVLRTLGPDALELQFGVKLAGEAGAIIAKTTAEGHFSVKLSWSPNGPSGEMTP